VEIVNSTIDGGIPPWHYRSDYKDPYAMIALDCMNQAQTDNNLVRKTSRVLLNLEGTNSDTLIAQNEFRNAHDLYLGGEHTDFNHNWVHNIQDDALFLNASDLNTGIRVHENVFEQVRTLLSFSGHQPGGPKYIYGNIFDLRVPTLGYRPSSLVPSQANPPWFIFGQPLKYDPGVGPFAFYRNTLIVSGTYAGTTSNDFASLPSTVADNPMRWMFNNLFISYELNASDAFPLGLFPSPAQLSATLSKSVILLPVNSTRMQYFRP
jgi:hypothetical protein